MTVDCQVPAQIKTPNDYVRANFLYSNCTKLVLCVLFLVNLHCDRLVVVHFPFVDWLLVLQYFLVFFVGQNWRRVFVLLAFAAQGRVFRIRSGCALRRGRSRLVDVEEEVVGHRVVAHEIGGVVHSLVDELGDSATDSVG